MSPKLSIRKQTRNSSASVQRLRVQEQTKLVIRYNQKRVQALVFNTLWCLALCCCVHCFAKDVNMSLCSLIDEIHESRTAQSFEAVVHFLKIELRLTVKDALTEAYPGSS